MKLKKLFAFTLAEVLITLSILGVVAAITVPSIIQRNSEREVITKLKKNYSILSDAIDTMMAEEGTSIEAFMKNLDPSALGLADYVDKLKPYLNISKDCGTNTSNNCMSENIYYKRLQGTSQGDNVPLTKSSHRRLILKDGTLLAIGRVNNCDVEFTNKDGGITKICGEFLVDVNGYKAPNRYGYDAFKFLITKNGVEPESSPDECNKNGTNEWNGLGCTAWAIYKGNMDYKRKTISWN